MLSVSVKKLKSNNGASISIALLLFLVCAVIGAVVLTAATAASGRFSELAKSDRRYYSVTSAVKLLKKTIEEEEVSISFSKIKDNDDTNESFVTTFPAAAETTLLEDIVLNGIDKLRTEEEKWNLSDVNYTMTETKGLKLKVMSGNNPVDSLEVDVTVYSNENGKLTVTVSSGEAGEKYTQTLIFTPTVDTTVTTQKNLTSTTETKTFRYNWTLTEIK